MLFPPPPAKQGPSRGVPPLPAKNEPLHGWTTASNVSPPPAGKEWLESWRVCG